MAYTNAWDVTRPLGSVLANQIDTEIQAVRRDIQERLTTLFSLGAFTADPLQGVSLNLKGTTASKIVPGSVSLSLRNNADSADNLIITDAGLATFRGMLTDAAGVRSLGGTTAVTGSAVPVTLFTPTVIGRYEVQMNLGGSGSSYMSRGTYAFDGITMVALSVVNAALSALTLSGNTVQATQSSGSVAAIQWGCLLTPTG